MKTASKTTTSHTMTGVRHRSKRATAVSRPVGLFLCPSPSAEAVVEAQPSSISPSTAWDSFGADLVREIKDLRGYAVWLCNSRTLADDLIQDTLLRAWAARDRFQAGSNLKAWCATILRNVFFSYSRRSWRLQPLPDNIADQLTTDTVDAEHRLDLLALRNAIALLPLEQREALLLVGVGGQSYIEAAEICACAVGTVKSRVSRARAQLAVLMSDRGVSYNSDPGLEAGETLHDLLSQALALKTRETSPA